MTEHTGELLKKERAKYDDRVTPAIILISGVFGNTGEGIARVKGSVEQAVGSDILFGNE
jgi:V/A-type H+-transporting ATPase subunit F